jgi:outer membrane receptor for ferrienterochelin and colicin
VCYETHVYIFLLLYITDCLIPQNGIAQEGGQDIQDLSLDSLLNMRVSAAAKYEQKISEAPASVSITTSEDIEFINRQTPCWMLEPQN